ncbi:MAG: Cna B-type domain-containing protein [Lachnospiraceae bacterium]|nr:Cna B-type domain-containing protein [Lachnospiraceae bacterium]
MNTIKRIVWISSVILILVSSAGRGAHAAEAADKVPQTTQMEAGSLLVEAESAGSFRYEEEEGKLYIYGGTVCIKLNPAVDYSRDKIEVSGYATLVLNGVRIIAENGPALRVIPGADAEIRLAEGEKTEEGDAPVMENFLQGAEGYAGIEAGTLPGGEEGHLLEANLRIKGKGYLAAIGGDGAAAIGASRGQYACGLISIEEGNITAIAGKNADAIGCGAESNALPARAPLISDKTISLLALCDGTGHAISDAMPNGDGEKADTFSEGFAPASILTAVLPGYAEESMSDSSDVRVRDTQGNGEISFSMPEGYREFAVKTDANCEYMVEQDGRIFAGSKEESEEIDEDAVLFRGTTDYTEETLYLTPLSQNPAIDIFVTGLWEDDDDNDGTRPESVNVTLYANGKETGRTITLSEENDWSGTFEELAVYSDCVRQSYSVVEERLEGYTGLISGSDLDGYTITNSHEPLPEGRSGEEEISQRSRGTIEEGKIVATVLTTKVSSSMPARTSTTIKKTHSAKTADSSNTLLWGGMLLMAVIALFIWMRIEQSKE